MTAMKTTEKRLCVLGEDAIEALYGRPRFTHDERIQYFSLSPMEKAALEELHSLDQVVEETFRLWRKHHLGYDQTKNVVERVRRRLALEPPRRRNRTVAHRSIRVVSKPYFAEISAFARLRPTRS
jgi:hypothetical protein